jgi:glutamate/tyrosine decarboxylase-like PLP-dependent enzyme
MAPVDPRLLQRAAELAAAHLAGLPDRHVAPRASAEELRAALGGSLPETGEPPARVIEALAAGAEGGLMASPGPRYFGFVIGGALPAALAADWLTSAWDQNAGAYVMSPAAAIVEETVGRWMLDLLGLPPTAGVGLVTGATMANFTCLAAARGAVLARAGWDVDEHGLFGGPAVRVLAGAEVHATALFALRLLGFGRAALRLVPVDDQGRMRADELARALAEGDGPVIVCAQAGNVDSGAFDPLAEIVDAAHAHGAWCHVDGAFGLWARASAALAPLAAGAERADSWAVDAHKWLNVPYDGAFAFVADAAAHRRAMSLVPAAYLPAYDPEHRSGYDWAPEASRRARAFAAWAALRSLGRRGAGELVERCCALARRMAGRLDTAPGVEVLNDVVLNQVLVRFGDDDGVTADVVRRVQDDGTCWAGGSAWHGRGVMRISISNWATAEADVDASADAIIAAARAATSP